MNRNRRHLFLNSDIVRGRYLKEDGLGGATGANPLSTSHNTQEGQSNSSTAGSDESSKNNTGEEFDASTFWGSQGSGSDGSPDSESASSDGSGSDTSEELRAQLTERLNNLSFGDPVMTQEIAEQINNGDFSGFQTSLNAALGQAVRQALGLSVSVLKPFAEQIMTQVRDEISQTMGRRDDNDQLIRDFPAAKDKKIYPVVKNLYDQALKNTKGDRPAAVKQVKEMMRLMSTSVADDLGLTVAPRGADDNGRPQNQSINWLDELNVR